MDCIFEGGVSLINSSMEYTISEAAEIIGYAPHVLRFYEKEFNIDIPRKDSNHRYYTYKEIELMEYIKNLKDKGFGNKQINLIINSTETVLNNNGSNDSDIKDLTIHDANDHSKKRNNSREIVDIEEVTFQISEKISQNFFEKLSTYFAKENKDEDLKGEIMALKNEIHSKERDILVSENARLKMKVKEKTYENIKLKEELGRLKKIKKASSRKYLVLNNKKELNTLFYLFLLLTNLCYNIV